MAQESLMELMHKPEINGAMQAMMFNFYIPQFFFPKNR